ncbi:MAG: hypothetical protein ABI467_21430 [Kofleriaceae bacterium]
MRAALAVVTLIVTGCQDLHGIAVIVQPGDPAVTSVRLFVGTGGATSASLTTSAQVAVDDVAYWSRDPGNANDVVTGVDGTGEVRFVFETSAAIPVVIAVGYDVNHAPIAAGELTDLERRDAGFTGYELALTGPIAPLGAQDAPVQLGLWSPDLATSAYDAACAGIVVAGADHPYFVVTDQDQDCDGLTDDDVAHECTPDAYLGTRGADPDEISCLASDSTTGGSPTCKLGGATCTDNLPRMQDACSPSHICALAQVCNACGTSYACAANAEPHLTALDHYECAIGLEPDHTVCPTTFTLDRPPTGGYDCTGFAIGDADHPLGDKLQVGDVELAAALDPSAASSCAVTLAIGGSSTAPLDFAGLVTFTLKNNAGIALPIHFTSLPTPSGCPIMAACTLVGDQTFAPPLTACAAAWNPPTAIANPTPIGDATEPTLSADQLEMFYTSAGAIYRTTRTAIGGPWATGTVVQFGGFVTTSLQSFHSPELAPDGTEMLFTISDSGTGLYQPFHVTRSSTTAAVWNTPAPVSYATTGFSVVAVAFGPGNQVVVGTTQGDASPTIYTATLDPTTLMLGNFRKEVAGADPYLTPDGMQLYFDATNATNGTAGLEVASRRTPLDGFAPPVALAELTTATSSVTAPWVPAGGRRIYFTSKATSNTTPSLSEALRTSY